MTSLVPQVDQPDRNEIVEISEMCSSGVLTFEESLEFLSFRVGAALNDVVVDCWKILADDPDVDVPYCMNSQNEDGSWNFSWGYDFTEQNTRSCFYTITSPEVTVCREYPDEVITLNSISNQVDVTFVIISDLLQSHEWDKERVFKTYVEKRLALVKAEKAAQKYQNRSK